MNRKNIDVEKLKDQYFASCPKGLEECLKEEAEKYGLKNITLQPAGLLFESTRLEAIKFLLQTRIADRIFKSLYRFDVANEKDLYQAARSIKWKALFNVDQTFRIKATLAQNEKLKKNSHFRSPIYLAQTLKDAIVDRFREDTQSRPDIDKSNPNVGLFMHIRPVDNPHSRKETVTILLDLCGDALGKRGYRQHSFEAPVRENLAAGIISLMNISQKQCFWDCMCGSGTVVIEYLLNKYKITPTYLKIEAYLRDETPWAFLEHNFYNKDEKLVKHTQELMEKLHKRNQLALEKMHKEEGQTWASDLSKTSIETTKANLRSAKMENIVHLSMQDATAITPGEEFNGIIFANPPYGERLVLDDIAKLYFDLGENFKESFQENTFYLFTANRDCLKNVALKSSRKHILFNGNLEARLARYELY